MKNLKEKVASLQKEIYVISLALTDKRTRLSAKIMIVFTISFFLSPIDLIPDFIPVFGYLDDLIILPLLIAFTIKLIPEKILTDCRYKVNEKIKLNKKFRYIFSVIVVILWTLIIGFVVINLS